MENYIPNKALSLLSKNLRILTTRGTVLIPVEAPNDANKDN